jgi:hypothetical protein
MGTNLLGELAANNGTYIMLADSDYDANLNGHLGIDRIIVLEPTYIESLYVTNDENNLIDDYVSCPSCLIPAGAILTPKDDLKFTFVQISDGALCLILGA